MSKRKIRLVAYTLFLRCECFNYDVVNLKQDISEISVVVLVEQNSIQLS